MSDEDKKALESLIPDTKKTITVTDPTGTKTEEVSPTITHVSNIVEMLATGAEASVLKVENHYQMTLTVEKHVHSQNTEDIDRDYQFRLYLRKPNGQGGYDYYTEPLYEASQIGSRNPDDWGWDQLDSQTPYTVADGKNYYEFTLKDVSVEGEGSITFGVPAGYEYVVEEYVGGNFKVFRPFLKIQKVDRDENGNVKGSGTNVEWKKAYQPIKEDGISGTDYKATPLKLDIPQDKLPEGFDHLPNVLLDDTKVTFINERQIVRTGVALNSAPFMTMLAVVFMAGAGLCVRYLRKKAEEEGDLFD